jgi:hypothetical protein
MLSRRVCISVCTCLYLFVECMLIQRFRSVVFLLRRIGRPQAQESQSKGLLDGQASTGILPRTRLVPLCPGGVSASCNPIVAQSEQSIASAKTIPDKIFDFNRLACFPPAPEDVEIIGGSRHFCT